MEKTKIKISASNLSALLREKSKNAVFCSFDSLTEPKMRKTIDLPEGGRAKNPHFGTVKKLATNNFVMLFTDPAAYERMVNRRLAETGKEANFTTSSNWFSHIEKTCLVCKKSDTNEEYLYAIFAEKAETLADKAQEMGLKLSSEDTKILSEYRTGGFRSIHKNKVSYLMNGKTVKKSQIIGLAEKETEGKQGGLDEEAKVVIRVYKLSSIIGIRIDGCEYEVHN